MTGIPSKNNGQSANVDTVAEVYSQYYQHKGLGRNDLFNPEVLFQHLAYEKCHIESFRDIEKSSRVIDVGGGSGAGVLNLLKYGFKPENISVVDIQPERIKTARSLLPGSVNVVQCDATNMEFAETGSFDVATSSTMFLQILDQDISFSIAQEMVRVVRENGRILVFDWRYDFWNKDYVACDLKRMTRLFSIGKHTSLNRRVMGQLIPPLGRFLSRYCQSAYFLIHKIPLCAGLVCYVLSKRQDNGLTA